MNKIVLVIKREFLTRVRKPSFWILTIIVPILLAALYAIPIYLALKPAEKSVVMVVDESGLFGGLDREDTLRSDSRFVSTDNVAYRYAATFDYARRAMKTMPMPFCTYVGVPPMPSRPMPVCITRAICQRSR